MAREILLNLNKKKSSFAISKIDRKKLYGFKKRLFIDEKGKECSKANLEEETGIVFVNSDISSCYLDHKGNYIEKKENLSVKEIFSQKGEIYFRKLENTALKEIVNNKENFVISLGGGTPCFYDTMEWLKSKTNTKTILKLFIILLSKFK